MRSHRTVLLGSTAVLSAVGLMVAGCAKAKATALDGATVNVVITDAGCQPSPISVAAGPVTFKLTNKGSAKVTEAELTKDGSIIGEKENLSPGLSGSFSLKLGPGKYQMYCPNAGTDRFDFVVTGAASSVTVADSAVKTDLDAAVAGYRQYVIAEVGKLVPATEKFTDAVRAGDVSKAKSLYAPARYYYEEVEPVAESFGELDPEVDARIDDVDDISKWTGFHRLEKALWADKSLTGTKPVADKLDADVIKLRDLVADATYQPAQLANGASELLNEVGSSKITGEEDRYGHTDGSDFRANIDGAKKAYDLLVPALQKVDPALAATVTARFAELDKAIARYPATIDYSTVTDAARRTLTQSVDDL